MFFCTRSRDDTVLMICGYTREFNAQCRRAALSKSRCKNVGEKYAYCLLLLDKCRCHPLGTLLKRRNQVSVVAERTFATTRASTYCFLLANLIVLVPFLSFAYHTRRRPLGFSRAAHDPIFCAHRHYTNRSTMSERARISKTSQQILSRQQGRGILLG